MLRHPKCAKLRDEAKSNKWRDMLVFYCREGSHEDVQIARQISELSARWATLITERGRFIEELKTLDNFYAKKMVAHLTAVQEKYDVRLIHVFTLVDELDLSACSKDLFILRLQGSEEM
ncbi:hypothetical protein CTI12_AA432440 [Artemisia annua]|uniref:Uncharacterized protein n=1 Tax=Artemisia annua TaxID=35608 RepID=A0A2U1LFT0_ARTAN|nr:hypothetical protein CTI12_AA432440 [Artemisia annua]